MNLVAGGQIPLDNTTVEGVQHFFDQQMKEVQGAQPQQPQEFQW